MTPAAVVLLAVAAVAAIVDWAAVGRGLRRVEFVAKPAATLAILGAAAALDAARPAAQRWFVVALGAALVGDVFLMLGPRHFLAGLGSFLLAHLAFIGGLLEGGAGHLWVAVPVAAVALVVGARLLRALRRDAHGALVAPVVAYVVVIGAMVTVAVASGNAPAAAGAVAFLASDAMIGEQRFVQPRRLYPVAIMVTYHAALVLLVLSLRI